jgi:hypothetical protein
MDKVTRKLGKDKPSICRTTCAGLSAALTCMRLEGGLKAREPARILLSACT